MENPEDKLTKEFLTELLTKEDVSVDDKIKQIISEHNAYNRALVDKRNELLGEVTKLKETKTALEKSNEENTSKIKGLEEMLEKANNGDQKAKEYYETKLADEQKKFTESLENEKARADKYEALHLNNLRDKAIEEGTKDLNFVSGLKQGFIARVLSMNEFKPEDIDHNGKIKFLNAEHHTIEEVIQSFALSAEGKSYIANPSTGGGARGSSSTLGTSANKNPFKAGQENLTEQMRLYKEDRATYDRLKAEAGL